MDDQIIMIIMFYFVVAAVMKNIAEAIRRRSPAVLFVRTYSRSIINKKSINDQRTKSKIFNPKMNN